MVLSGLFQSRVEARAARAVANEAESICSSYLLPRHKDRHVRVRRFWLYCCLSELRKAVCAGLRTCGRGRKETGTAQPRAASATGKRYIGRNSRQPRRNASAPNRSANRESGAPVASRLAACFLVRTGTACVADTQSNLPRCN